MSKRQETRQKNRIDAYIEDTIQQRTIQLVEAILDGYEERLNRYLKDSSSEFIEENVKYRKIKLNLEKEWVEPSPEQRMQIEKTRNVLIGENEKIFRVVLRRNHYNDPEMTDKKESYQVWGTAGFRTEDLNTTKRVETVVLESLIGYLAEKGVEYIEAERSLYRQHAPEQSPEEVAEGETA